MRYFFTTKKTKTWRNKLSVILYPLFIVFLTACGNPPEDTALTIHLGGGSGNVSASSLANWPPADGTELASLKYEVTLSGPSGQIIGRKDIPGDSGTISFKKLSTGYWTVKVEAFSDGELYAYSFTGATLKRGNNEVFMMMHRAGIYKVEILVASDVTSVARGNGGYVFSAETFSSSPERADHLSYVWTVSGHTSSGTYITADGNNGYLTVGADETSGTLIIKAESINSLIDEPIYGTITVNVVDAIINISVSPASAIVTRGLSQQFTAMVSGIENHDVIWSVKGSTLSGTNINSAGILSVDAGENSGTILTVTATSVVYPSKIGSATVTVSDKVYAIIPSLSLSDTAQSYMLNDPSPTALSVMVINAADTAAQGGTLTYQWYMSNSYTVGATPSGGTAISGALGANYTPPTGTAGIIYYFVVVTNTIADNLDGGQKVVYTVSNVVAVTVRLIDMVWIPAGTFIMGSSSDSLDNGATPPHQVTLTNGFYMGKYEVTQGQYEAVMGINPSNYSSNPDGGSRDDLPVENVNWYHAIAFCNRLSILEGRTPVYTISGKNNTDFSDWQHSAVPTSSDATWDATTQNMNADGYRLPTEAEWEYACRAGTTTAYSFGDNGTLLGNYAWFFDTAYYYTTHEVGQKLPNAWGLYDIHGNVWEWCWDWSGAYGSGSQIDPVGAATGTYRVLHGGAWNCNAQEARSAFRLNNYPYYMAYVNGFRVVRP